MKGHTDNSILLKAKHILSDKGLYSFLKQGMLFVWNSLQSHGDYFIVEFDYHNQPGLPDIKPRVNCSYKPITDVAEFDQLVAQGYIFGHRNFRPRLKKGAIAFCLFIDKVLVSETWAAANEHVKKVVDPIPYNVAFDKGEVCIGIRFTDPKYRRNGLSEYLYVMRFPYLKENFIKGKASVNVNNKVSQSMNEKFYGKVVARGRYIRFARWQHWKEKSVVTYQ